MRDIALQTWRLFCAKHATPGHLDQLLQLASPRPDGAEEAPEDEMGDEDGVEIDLDLSGESDGEETRDGATEKEIEEAIPEGGLEGVSPEETDMMKQLMYSLLRSKQEEKIVR